MQQPQSPARLRSPRSPLFCASGRRTVEEEEEGEGEGEENIIRHIDPSAFALFGVFDGHRGAEASAFVSSALPSRLAPVIAYAAFGCGTKAAEETLPDEDRPVRSSVPPSPPPAAAAAISNAGDEDAAAEVSSTDADDAFIGECIAEAFDSVDAMLRAEHERQVAARAAALASAPAPASLSSSAPASGIVATSSSSAPPSPPGPILIGRRRASGGAAPPQSQSLSPAAVPHQMGGDVPQPSPMRPLRGAGIGIGIGQGESAASPSPPRPSVSANAGVNATSQSPSQSNAFASGASSAAPTPRASTTIPPPGGSEVPFRGASGSPYWGGGGGTAPAPLKPTATESVPTAAEPAAAAAAASPLTGGTAPPPLATFGLGLGGAQVESSSFSVSASSPLSIIASAALGASTSSALTSAPPYLPPSGASSPCASGFGGLVGGAGSPTVISGVPLGGAASPTNIAAAGAPSASTSAATPPPASAASVPAPAPLGPPVGLQGSTAHVVLVTADRYYFCNVGDSRGYLVTRRPGADAALLPPTEEGAEKVAAGGADDAASERDANEAFGSNCGSVTNSAVRLAAAAAGTSQTSSAAKFGAACDVAASLASYAVGVRAMSDDHRTARESERQRVVAAGGFILNSRVNNKLSVTRAFGDIDHKPNAPPQSTDLTTAATALAPPSSRLLDGWATAQRTRSLQQRRRRLRVASGSSGHGGASNGCCCRGFVSCAEGGPLGCASAAVPQHEEGGMVEGQDEHHNHHSHCPLLSASNNGHFLLNNPPPHVIHHGGLYHTASYAPSLANSFAFGAADIAAGRIRFTSSGGLNGGAATPTASGGCGRTGSTASATALTAMSAANGGAANFTLSASTSATAFAAGTTSSVRLFSAAATAPTSTALGVAEAPPPAAAETKPNCIIATPEVRAVRRVRVARSSSVPATVETIPQQRMQRPSAYDVLLIGCDGVWELQTAEVIGRRVVAAVEAALDGFYAQEEEEAQAEHARTAADAEADGEGEPRMMGSTLQGTATLNAVVGAAAAEEAKAVRPEEPASLAAPAAYVDTADADDDKYGGSATAGSEECRQSIAAVARQMGLLASPRGNGGGNDGALFLSAAAAKSPPILPQSRPSSADNSAAAVLAALSGDDRLHLTYAASASASAAAPTITTTTAAEGTVANPSSDESAHSRLTRLVTEAVKAAITDTLGRCCNTNCDVRGTTPGTDNLSLGAVLVLPPERIAAEFAEADAKFE